MAWCVRSVVKGANDKLPSLTEESTRMRQDPSRRQEHSQEAKQEMPRMMSRMPAFHVPGQSVAPSI